MGKLSPPPHYDELWSRLKWPADVTFDRTISYSLPLALPKAGHGLQIYHKYRDPITHQFYNYNGTSLVAAHPPSSVRAARAPGSESRGALELPKHIHKYEVGTLVVHSGHELHSIPSFPELDVQDQRVTLQGWGVWVPGRGWELFA